MTEKKAAFLALVLVILVPVLLLGQAIYDRESGTVWQVDITGYDPRDLLRGHYLQFRYDWKLRDQQTTCPSAGACCLCLTEAAPGNRVNPSTHPVSCQDRVAVRECSALVRGKTNLDEILSGGQVYFIPQSHAALLEEALFDDTRDFKMEIAIRRGGGVPVIRQLLVDGYSLPDFVRQNPPE